MIYYNPLDKFYKSLTGAVCARQSVAFRVKGDFNSVVFVLKNDSDNVENYYSMKKQGDFFEVELEFDKGLYFYYFSLDNGRFIGKGKEWLGEVMNYPQGFQLTVFSENYFVPSWLNGGIIYQIFPDRFYSANKSKTVEDGKIMHECWEDTPCFEPNNLGQVLNNDFFGGDILGIVEKLPYIKSLGVTAIYLNPIFRAYSNHRYDTGNYMEIDPLLGNEYDFKTLINEANKLNIKIILDGVFNHTGDDSLYFNRYGNYDSIGAYQDKNSPYYSWYNFKEYPNNYESWWGIKTLPSVNENASSYIDYIAGKDGVIECYTKMGVAGWRLDVVDELPGTFVERIRSAVKGVNENAIIIGEVWEDASNKVAYGVRRKYFQGFELDSVMNYPLKNAIIQFVKLGDSKALSETVKQQLDHYPHKVLHCLMNILSTHDTFRLITAVGGESADNKTKKEMSNMSIPKEQLSDAKFKLKLASLLQFTLFGVPSIYYGDEIAMQGYIDPLNRKCYPWGKEDFEILNWYRLLGKIRNSYSAFVDGDYEEICSVDGIFVFKRFSFDSEILVVANASDKQFILEFNGDLTNLFDDKKYSDEYLVKEKSFALFIKND